MRFFRSEAPRSSRSASAFFLKSDKVLAFFFDSLYNEEQGKSYNFIDFHNIGKCKGTEVIGLRTEETLARELLEKAREFGADLAGLAAVADLVDGPSEQLFPQMKDHARDHFAEQVTTGLPHGAVKWDPAEQTLLVFAVSHPEEDPELDWWYGEINPPGNQLLAQIARSLRDYLAQRAPEVQVWLKPYHVEKGGVYLKDAAVAAGLGRIGRNNLLITPQYGPRVRLRAIGLSAALPSSPPLEEDPCQGCGAPCRKACPRAAFSQVIYTPEETGLEQLPARDGTYYRQLCALEMERNENNAVPTANPELSEEPLPLIRYCRACEFACRIPKHPREKKETQGG